MTSPAVRFWVGMGLKIISPLQGLMAARKQGETFSRRASMAAFSAVWAWRR
jgi:hypothetical protein